MANAVRKTKTSEAGQDASYLEARSALPIKAFLRAWVLYSLALRPGYLVWSTTFIPTGSISAKKQVNESHRYLEEKCFRQKEQPVPNL